MEMTIKAAADHWNVSQDTVRRRIRKQQVAARQIPRAQGHVWMVQVEERHQAAPGPEGGTDPGDDGMVAFLKEQLAVKDQLIDRLTQLLGAKTLNAAPRRWWQFWG